MNVTPLTVVVIMVAFYAPTLLFAALGWFLFYVEWRAHRRFSMQVVKLVKSLGLTLDATAKAWVNKVS